MGGEGGTSCIDACGSGWCEPLSVLTSAPQFLQFRTLEVPNIRISSEQPGHLAVVLLGVNCAGPSVDIVCGFLARFALIFSGSTIGGEVLILF